MTKRKVPKSITAFVAAAGLILAAPAAASAAEVVYYNGQSPKDAWQNSGHQSMSGGIVFGYNHGQNVSIKNGSNAMVSGLFEAATSHPAGVMNSMCGWHSELVDSATNAQMTCRYTSS